MSNPQRFFRHSRVVYNASLDAMIRLLSRNSEVVNFSGLKHSRSEFRMVSEIIGTQLWRVAYFRGPKAGAVAATSSPGPRKHGTQNQVIFPTAGSRSRNRRGQRLNPSAGP